MKIMKFKRFFKDIIHDVNNGNLDLKEAKFIVGRVFLYFSPEEIRKYLSLFKEIRSLLSYQIKISDFADNLKLIDLEKELDQLKRI